MKLIDQKYENILDKRLADPTGVSRVPYEWPLNDPQICMILYLLSILSEFVFFKEKFAKNIELDVNAIWYFLFWAIWLLDSA